MKILRNILLFFLPVLLVVNITRYFFMGYNVFTYHGIQWVFYNIGTFNGLSHTIESINTIGMYANNMLGSDNNAFEVLGNAFMMLFYGFAIPVTVVVDIILDITWVFRFLWI